MSLGQQLKEMRKNRGWSIVETAEKIQVPVSSYRGWEEGRRFPVEMLWRLAEIYGISISQLLGQRRLSNQELAQAMTCFEEGMIHLRRAISQL
jgi:transcriptional regulator with XRE-family HTH domain